jgi:hypothetical protein
MYHGYPEDTIPPSCEYKIGTFAIGEIVKFVEESKVSK